MKVRITNNSDNPNPSYETSGSAGMDLRAMLDEPAVLMPQERKLIPTGIHIELPDGYEAQIRPRSGLAVKNGISIVNSPGTVDSDYRGEIKIILINLSNTEHTVQNGDRIAQMVIAKYEQVAFENSDNLISTERGSGGFDHTGNQ